MTRIASFNVENLFERPKAFDTADWELGEPALDAYRELNALFEKSEYSGTDKQRMLELLVQLDIYFINSQGAIRRKNTDAPKWAWLRKNRGKFDREPSDPSLNIEVIANGRADWIGWIELAKEPTNEIGVRMTARVIDDVHAQIIGIVEAEDRPSLIRFNEEFLKTPFAHVMLVDGNDERGIDVGIMTAEGYPIRYIRSNVDAKDEVGMVFSRDCPQYEVFTPGNEVIHVLVNHFKSQSGGGGEKRKRQADWVRQRVDELVKEGKLVVVMGDLNEGHTQEAAYPENLKALFEEDGPLVNCYGLSGFLVGNKEGTFDSCGIRNRLDYILISKSLESRFRGGGVFRKGLWGTRQTRPTDWETYEEMTNSSEQASDHALIYVDLDL